MSMSSFFKTNIGNLDEVARAAMGDVLRIELPEEPVRRYAFITVADGYIYVLGGIGTGGFVYHFHRINEKTLQPEKLTDAPAYSDSHKNMFSYNGKILIIIPSAGELVPYEYDIASDVWQEKSHQAVTGGWCHSCMYNGEIYIGAWNSAAGELYKYNPSTDTWTTLTGEPFRGVICEWQGKLIGSMRVYHSSGVYKYYQSIRVYDPVADAWSDFPVGFPVKKCGVRVRKEGYAFFTIDDELYFADLYGVYTPSRELFHIDTIFWKYISSLEQWLPIPVHPRLARLIYGFGPTWCLMDKHLYISNTTYLTDKTVPMYGIITRIPLDFFRRA